MFDMSEYDMPVLDSMQEPPLVWYTIMHADSPNLMEANHKMITHLQARSDTDAWQQMRDVIRNSSHAPGDYYAIRSPEADDLVVVRAQ